MAFTYLLRCSDGSYYVGSTRSLDLRLGQQAEGLGGAHTRRRRPTVLVWFTEFEHVGAAYAFERQLHGWSRAKKEMLIEGRWDELSGHSRRSRRR